MNKWIFGTVKVGLLQHSLASQPCQTAAENASNEILFLQKRKCTLPLNIQTKKGDIKIKKTPLMPELESFFHNGRCF